jgi:hypothetical protein
MGERRLHPIWAIELAILICPSRGSYLMPETISGLPEQQIFYKNFVEEIVVTPDKICKY